MFRSLAESAGANTLAVLLTGMGADGAAGMKELQETGAPTIAQDKNSSVVWGMPGVAVKLGAADMVLPLAGIPLSIMEWMQQVRGYGT
jgi:two-component system chemotaxis response regulator CheB